MLRSFVLITLALCTTVWAAAQKWTPRYIGMTSTTHGYYQYLPQGYKADGTVVYPLILYIHGNSERGKGDSVGLLKIIGGGLPNVMSQPGFPTSFTVNNQVHRFLVIAPQFEPRPNVIDVDSVLNYVLRHYPVDVNRIYLTGFSMGGGSCWDYAGSVPALTNKLAALLPVSGSGEPDTLKTRTIARANLPVWATHNDSDPTVSVQVTNMYIDWVNQAPAPVPAAKKTVFHATSHNAWAATYNPAFKVNGQNVFEWMLHYRRRPMAVPHIKLVKVTLYGGLNVYTQVQWNNWNVKQTLNWGKLRYNDATASAVQATLSNSSGITDNGSTYGSGMAPAEVLRYASFASIKRTLTLSGLSAAKNYSIELYASRNNYSGSATIFTINGTSQKISTYKNLTTKAIFSHLKCNTAGQLVVTISSANTYNYLNGFTLTEETTTVNQVPVANAGADATITLPANSITLSGSGHDNDGSIRSYKWVKTSGPIPFTISTPTAASTKVTRLTAGLYTFRLTVTDNSGATASDEVQVTVKAAAVTTRDLKINLYDGTNTYANTALNNCKVWPHFTAPFLNDTDATTTSLLSATDRHIALIKRSTKKESFLNATHPL